MATAPSAEYMKDPEPVGFHGPPPPMYDQAMEQGQFTPPLAQPAVAPFLQSNGKYSFKCKYVQQVVSVILI
jgi:hypothetical protein